ncbi:MAG: hypothetical protein AABY58_02160 [Nitrospirota bacterium]
MNSHDNYMKIICHEINIEAVKYFYSRLKAVGWVDLVPMLPLSIT